MDDSRIAARLRAQIVGFSGELSKGLCKPARRFVAEALYGIQARQSVMLSEIGRALNEEISLKKTETRLSNELRRPLLGDVKADLIVDRCAGLVLDTPAGSVSLAKEV